MLEHLKNLQAIGLNKNQAEVYLASLSLGSSTVMELSQKTNITRTTIYDNIRVLKEYNLITEIIDEVGKISFIPESPEKLINTLEYKQQKFQESLPELIKIFNSTKIKPKIQFFHGKQGVLRAMALSIQENPNKEIYILGNIEIFFKYFTQEELANRIQNRAKKAVRVYDLATNTFEEVKKCVNGDPKKNKRDLREIRIAPEGLEIPFIFYVFHNKVALFSSTREGYAIIFESPELSVGLKSLFNFLWELSEPFSLS